jgi:3-oxoacyl-[acyl-carrier protein] reductase
MIQNDMQQAVVLVSGGSKGLGLGVCQRLLEMNAKVATFSRSSTKEVESLMGDNPDRFLFLTGDTSKKESVQAVVHQVEKEFGPIYGLVNNAGVVDETLLSLQKDDDIDRVFDINLKGTLYLTKQAMRGMMIRAS